MIEIIFEKENNRSVAKELEKELGEATFSDSGRVWIINRTFVNNAYSGQGIARKLIDIIASEARKRNIKLATTCQYASNLFKEEKYQDVLISVRNK